MTTIRHQRLLGGACPVLVVACDHGEFDGPQPGLDNPVELLHQLPDSVDAVLMSPGTLAAAAGALGRRGGPLAIVRLNWNTVYSFSWNPVRAVSAPALSADAALRQGADAALVSLTLQTGSPELDAANVRLASELIQACRACGLPVIGEYFPAGADDRDSDDLHDEVQRGARIIAELGADAVKTFLEPTWGDVTTTTPVPVLALGAKRTGDDAGSLRLATEQLAAGARGLVYGRRVFQASDPRSFMDELAQTVHSAAVAAT
jgi:DhnA family fructose-bisphosphate aldolase class Ia